MPYGIYTVHQTVGWPGRELMSDFDVYIAQDGQTYRYLINNANFESYIKIVKVDAETGQVIPYAGAGFQLYNPDGSLITQTFTYPEITEIDTFYTNADGYLITPEPLEYGTGFSLVEVQAPYGYTLSTEPVYFDVTQDASSEEGGVTIIEVVKENVAQKGVIKVSKTGEVFASVVESNGVYQPVYEVQGLPDAVFEITAVEDVYTPDGTLRYSAGEVVDTVTTGPDGTAQSKPLYLGKFEIREIEFPYGMTDTGAEPQIVELTYAGQEIEITETSTGIYEMTHVEYGGVFVKESKAPDSFLLDENAYYVEITEQDKTYEVENEAGIGFVNMAQTGALRIEKTSSDGKLEGFAFRITGANGYDETFVTDENGEIHVELRVGDYTVSEVSNEASANYVLPADKTVTILADKTTVAEMHNELRDTPKTGDDSKPWLWAALMGVSVVGAVTLGVIGLKKRKKEDAE